MVLLGFFFFFFNDTATTEIYTLSLHDALPIYVMRARFLIDLHRLEEASDALDRLRSEEHTSELQSQSNLVCRLLLEKKKKRTAAAEPSQQTNRTRDSILRSRRIVLRMP